jgi:aspartyl-tRNA(Asn)/glutamyl-tRNA(Gln) amidotransferase subunit A
MVAEALLDLPLSEIAARVRGGEVSPVELAQATLARIERLEPTLNAYVTVTATEALAAARAAEREIVGGRYRGPLHGIPVGIKDLCDMAGTPTTAGSRLRAGRVAERDATVVRKLREAGAVLVGKLALHEFAFGPTGINAATGTARNPWDPERITGGSSSGSGAAVAAGECAAALGSDTGGSIRVPAALCGVVGLKPTHGRVSLAGVFPLAASLDHVGPMTRSVRDAALVLQAIAGHDPGDPWSAEVPVEDYAASLDSGARALRIGVPGGYVLDGCQPEVARAVERAVGVLTALGARVVEAESADFAAWWAAAVTVTLSEAVAVHHERYRTDAAGFGADVRGYLTAAMELPAHRYVQAAWLRDALRRGAAEDRLFARADVLVMPTTPVVAPRVADCGADDAAATLIHNTAPFNLTGNPAVSLPCGLTAAGLPIGLQMVGRHWDESTLLRAAAAYERARGPMPRPAALAR